MIIKGLREVSITKYDHETISIPTALQIIQTKNRNQSYYDPSFLLYGTSTNPKNAKPSATQNRVCIKAFLILISVELLLRRPRSSTIAIMITIPNTKYVN